MFLFIPTLTEIFRLLPPYLSVITIFLVILPTLITLLLRLFLYTHLQFLTAKLRQLLRGESLSKSPPIFNYVEQRIQRVGVQKDQINTPALVASSYGQERFRFFGIPLRCESVDDFTRNLPNLLLAFGLFGTFLGITINLANLSQTLTQSDLTEVGSLIEQLDQPLRGMGIAFITSLVAVFCSAVLTLINFLWNTKVAKANLLNSLEDYLDNIYSLTIANVSRNKLNQNLEKLVCEFNLFLGGFSQEFGTTLEKVMDNSVAQPLSKLLQENQKISQTTEQVYAELHESTVKMSTGSQTFSQAVNSLSESRFAEKLANAIGELAIAQNQFSQSALILNQSTKSLEDNLELMQKSILRVIRLAEEMTSIHEKYNLILARDQLKQKEI